MSHLHKPVIIDSEPPSYEEAMATPEPGAYNSSNNSGQRADMGGDLVIIESNRNIQIAEDWRGHRCKLQTTNAKIKAPSLYATADVELRTKNANIAVGSIEARNVELFSTNAKLVVQNRLITSGQARLVTSNAKILLEGDIYQVQKLYLQTSNAKIKAFNVKNPLLVNCQTSSSSVELGITACPADVHVEVTTSHGDIVVYMPDSFSGRVIAEAPYGTVTVSDQRDAALVYDLDTREKKHAWRCSKGAQGLVQLKTRHGKVKLTFL